MAKTRNSLLPSEKSISNETAEEAEHEGSAKKVGDVVGGGGIGQMHGSGQVGDEVHGYAERRQSLEGLNPYRNNQNNE